VRAKNLVYLYGWTITKENKPAIVMEYLEGGDLHHRVADPTVSDAEVCWWILGIGCGLVALHAHDLVHGDLSSHNVLVHIPFLSFPNHTHLFLFSLSLSLIDECD
jgi:serine/threonine protein kinase